MKGIIWGKASVDAWEKLEEIKANYLKVGFAIERESNAKSRTEREVWFSNGDYWMALKAQPNKAGRGFKANVSYIDRNIDKTLVNTIILHCTVAFPYSAIRYF